MKALSIHPQYAMAIFAGEKTVEIRSWKTSYRGDLLICSTAKKMKDTIPGHAICVVTLEDVVPFGKEHLKGAMATKADLPYLEDQYAWILTNVRYIRPIPLKGKLSLWEYNGPIEYLKMPESDEEDEKMYKEIYEPLFI